MRPSVYTRVVLGLVLAGATGAPVLAQDREPSGGYSAIIDNIDVLVDNYARFLARKYNLTEEQNEYTKHLLREKSYEFLDKHEERLRGLVDRLFEVRGGGDMSPDELVQWGQEIQPIYDEAKRIIIGGNDEWREILNEDQKRIHDEDLRLMTDSFATTEDQLDRIRHGNMTVEEFRNPRARVTRRNNKTPGTVRSRQSMPEQPVDAAAQAEMDASGVQVEPLPRTGEPVPPMPPPQRTDVAPPPPPEEISVDGKPVPPRVTPPTAARTVDRPAGVGRSSESPGDGGRSEEPPQPPNSRVARGAPMKSAAGYEGQWDKYVADFIVRYTLDEEQQQKAHTILDNCKAQASRYLRGKESLMTQLDAQLEEAKKSTDKEKASAISSIQKKRSDLEAPVNDIFEKSLKPRLEKLPTRAQRKAEEQAAAEKKSPRGGRRPR